MSELTQKSSAPDHAGKIIVAIALIAGLAVAVLAYWFFFLRDYVSSNDARFSGHLVDLAPEIAGTLDTVFVQAGKPVQRGQPVFQLDAKMLESALAQQAAMLETAKGNLAAVQARCQRAVNGPRPGEVEVAEATAEKLEVEEALARLELGRSESLFKAGSATRDNLDRAQAAYDAAKASQAQARANLKLLQDGTRPEDISAARGDVEVARSRVAEAEAAVARARLDLERTRVSSPFDGWVVRRWLDPGAMVSAGRPVVTVFDPATLRVDANVEEKYLHRVAIGDEVEIRVDAYPGLELKGHVSEILRAVQSEFSLIPSEGVSGTYIKVSQRVPLRIAVEAPRNLPLGPGLSVDIKVRIGSAAPSATESPAHD